MIYSAQCLNITFEMAENSTSKSRGGDVDNPVNTKHVCNIYAMLD